MVSWLIFMGFFSCDGTTFVQPFLSWEVLNDRKGDSRLFFFFFSACSFHCIQINVGFAFFFPFRRIIVFMS